MLLNYTVMRMKGKPLSPINISTSRDEFVCYKTRSSSITKFCESFL
jgi:hypothetical protein